MTNLRQQIRQEIIKITNKDPQENFEIREGKDGEYEVLVRWLKNKEELLRIKKKGRPKNKKLK